VQFVIDTGIVNESGGRSGVAQHLPVTLGCFPSTKAGVYWIDPLRAL
jgi:hypothetical protein